MPPGRPNLRVSEYAQTWLAWRNISSRTRQHYCRLLARHLLPTFASAGLCDINPNAVNAWYADVAATTPAVRAHSYLVEFQFLRLVTGD